MILDRPSSVDDAIGALLGDPAITRLLAAHRVIEPQPPRYAPWPEGLDPRLVDALRGRGFEALYTHQAAAVESVRARRNVCVVTPTASGKTLCYNLPVIDAVARDEAARALYLFPTKALAADQLVELRALAEAADIPLKTHTYDGDTPTAIRSVVRSAGQVAITNPDMLHSAILPHHTKWFKLFENLQFVVIDELHTYRGLFGSHVANVIRRLRRVCRHYGADPVFICASATIANPGELAERLLEAPVDVIDESGAPRGRKHILVVNPPVANPQLGIRGSALLTGQLLAERLIGGGVQTIAFASSRTQVEVLTTYLRETFEPPPGHPHTIRGYRGGYLPNQRHEIEARPARRPGARRGRHQRAGAGDRHRQPGRGHQRRLPRHHRLDLAADGTLRPAIGHQPGRAGLLIGAHRPVPGRASGVPVRHARRSTAWSTRTTCTSCSTTCARPASSCRCPPPSASGSRRRRPCSTCWRRTATSAMPMTTATTGATTTSRPATSACARGAPENVVIVDTTGDRHRVLGEVDLFAAPLLVHEKAIYIHEGVQHHVDRLDWDERKAYVTRTDVDYYTDADLGITLKVLEVFEEADERPAGKRQRGEVMVAWKVTMFKKLKFHTHENVGWGSISIPEQEMHTTATLAGAAGGAGEPIRPRHAGRRPHRARAGGAHHRLPAADVRPARPGRAGAGAGTVHRPADALPLRRDARRRRPDRAALHAHRLSLIRTSRQAVESCPCADGCPACVGPAIEVGRRGKQVVVELLSALMAEPAVAARSLADRLASFRQPVARPAVVREDRLELLARWFGARTLVVEDGRALVVERQLPLPAEVSRAVAERPAAAYFDTETTGLSTGAGHGHLPRRRGTGATATPWSCASTCSPTTRTSDRCCARWPPTWPPPIAWSPTTGAPSTCRCWPRA